MIIQDIVTSASIRRDKDGFSAERVFIADGVGGNPESKIYTAMTMAGIPQYGDPHPFLTDAIVTNVNATPIKSGGQIRIIVSYSVPDPDTEQTTIEDDEVTAGTLSLNSATSSRETHFDINGDLLKVEWRGLLTTSTFVTPVNVQRPQLSVQFKRSEPVVPKAIISNYLGKVNSVAWSGFPAKTWLCSGITANENKGVFDVEYSFTYNEDDWTAEIIPFLSPEQAKEQPPDREQANGYAVFDVYPLADFNALGISF